MRHAAFGPERTSLPVIGLGTWRMDRTRGEPVAALRRGLDLGARILDTAEIYGHGAVESLVGEAIAGRRDDVYLVTKVWHQNASREGTIAACEGSLRRLGTERIDLLLLHWPSEHPLEGTIDALQALREQGKIGAYGVSNFDAARLERALALAGPGGIAANQVVYHLGHRRAEAELFALCAAHDVAIMAYSPFGSDEGFPPHETAAAALEETGARHGATPRQVALAFLAREPHVFPIPKASYVRHVDEDLGAGDLVLDADDCARIDRACRGPAQAWPPIP